MGKISDGIAEHMREYPDDRTFVASTAKPVDVVRVLKKSGAEIALNYLPVRIGRSHGLLRRMLSGSRCQPHQLHSGIHRVGSRLGQTLCRQGIPLVGDDVKSQVGATIVHRTLAKLFEDRGAKLTGPISSTPRQTPTF